MTELKCVYYYHFKAQIFSLSLVAKIIERVVKSNLTSNNLLNPTSLHTLSTTPLKLLCSTFTIILLML